MAKGIFNSYYIKSIKNNDIAKSINEKWGDDLYKDLLYRLLFERFTYDQFYNFLDTLVYFNIIRSFTLCKLTYDPKEPNAIFTMSINGNESGCKVLWEIFGRPTESYYSFIQYLYQISVPRKMYIKSIYMLEKENN